MGEHYLWNLVDLQAKMIKELRSELRKKKMGLDIMTNKYMALEEEIKNKSISDGSDDHE